MSLNFDDKVFFDTMEDLACELIYYCRAKDKDKVNIIKLRITQMRK